MAKPNAKDPLKTPAKSAGWLIDGMEKEKNRNADARDPERSGKLGESDSRDRKETENSRLNSKDRIEADDDRSRTRERESDRSHELKPGEKVPNPLTGYMASWMTPGDFSLLQKPAAISGSGFMTPLPDFTSPGGPGFDSAASGGIAAAASPGFVPGPAPIENPYLRSLGGPAPATGGGLMELAPHQTGELAPAPLAPAAPWMSAPSPEPARANPLVPENLKPSDDTKYFPQLKRF